jgi:hypothetical protein
MAMVRTSRSNKRTAKLRAVAMRRSLLTTFSLLLVTALALSVDLHRPGRASAQAPDIHQIIPIIPGFPSLPPLPGLPGVSGAPTPPTVRNLAPNYRPAGGGTTVTFSGKSGPDSGHFGHSRPPQRGAKSLSRPF